MLTKLVILLLNFFLVSISFAETIKIAAGPIETRYYLIASKLCYLFEKNNNNLTCEVITTNGSIENLELLKDNKADLAIAQSDIATEAFNGTGNYQTNAPFLELRQLLNLFTESLTIITRDDDQIKKFSDLNNKKISYGSKNSATHKIYKELKNFYPEVSPIEIDLLPDNFAQKLCNNEIDALLIMAGHPSNIIKLIDQTCNLEFVSIENDKLNSLLESNKGLQKYILKKEIYHGIAHNQHTIGVTTILLSKNKNHEIIANLIKKFPAYLEELQKNDELLKNVSSEFFTTNFILPKY